MKRVPIPDDFLERNEIILTENIKKAMSPTSWSNGKPQFSLIITDVLSSILGTRVDAEIDAGGGVSFTAIVDSDEAAVTLILTHF